MSHAAQTPAGALDAALLDLGRLFTVRDDFEFECRRELLLCDLAAFDLGELRARKYASDTPGAAEAHAAFKALCTILHKAGSPEQDPTAKADTLALLRETRAVGIPLSVDSLAHAYDRVTETLMQHKQTMMTRAMTAGRAGRAWVPDPTDDAYLDALTHLNQRLLAQKRRVLAQPQMSLLAQWRRNVAPTIPPAWTTVVLGNLRTLVQKLRVDEHKRVLDAFILQLDEDHGSLVE